MPSNKIAIIMAGGSGAKLWPSSSDDNAKQFINFFNNGSMLKNTYDRLLAYFDEENILVATYNSQKDQVLAELPNLKDENLILEPFGRNTSACIALCGISIFHRFNSDDIVFAFPADHFIQNENEFYKSLDLASQTAEIESNVVTIGLSPIRPSKRYGYIQIGESESDVKDVYSFVEKPDINTAGRLIESGDFLWNSGIFIWKVDILFQQFDTHLPDLAKQFKSLREFWGKPDYEQNVEYVFQQIDSVSIDYGILENASNVKCVKAHFAWSDIGTWDEMFRLSERDNENNSLKGDVIAINTHDSLVHSSEKTIGIVGMKDIIVVESNDSILVCNRGESEMVKDIIDNIRRNELKKLI